MVNKWESLVDATAGEESEGGAKAVGAESRKDDSKVGFRRVRREAGGTLGAETLDIEEGMAKADWVEVGR